MPGCGLVLQQRMLQMNADHITDACLSTDQIMTKLGWEPLYSRRQAFVNECIANRVPRYLFNYFNVRNRDIRHYKTSNSNDLILEKVYLACSKRAFFYEGVTIFYNSF